MKTTDCDIYFQGEITRADPHGNNVAWACHQCGRPILFVCLANQKGFNGKATACRQCGTEYTMRVNADGDLVIEKITK